MFFSKWGKKWKRFLSKKINLYKIKIKGYKDFGVKRAKIVVYDKYKLDLFEIKNLLVYMLERIYKKYFYKN